MNYNSIKDLPFKERKMLVNTMCIFYRKTLGIKYINENHVVKGLEDSGYKGKLQTYKNLSIFDTIINLLDDDEAQIIENEFINLNKDWWKDRWSKTTYYKKKHSAINNFIYLIYA